MSEFPKKISENDSPMMARYPARWSAWGACSREEPQPKFLRESRMLELLYCGRLSTKFGSLRHSENRPCE